jgi:hypothetical protein
LSSKMQRSLLFWNQVEEDRFGESPKAARESRAIPAIYAFAYISVSDFVISVISAVKH